MVETAMNRGSEFRLVGAALVAAAAHGPAFAADASHSPSLSIDPIVATNLLAPVEDANGQAASYRLDPALETANGQRAKLSVEVGEATMFAITGRLQRQPTAVGPLNPRDMRALGTRHESGKVYGAGVSTNFRGVDLSATYQYSKLRSEQGESEAQVDGPGRSHSLRATARIRFRR